MDHVDVAILNHLMRNGRAAMSEIGVAVGLTGPAISERVRRLEQSGAIRGYAALVDPETVGAALTAFVAVTVEGTRQSEAFLADIQELKDVQECHHVAGEDSYLLKVRTQSTRTLERLISDTLKRLPGVVRTRTTIVLSTAKETARVPLYGGERP